MKKLTTTLSICLTAALAATTPLLQSCFKSSAANREVSPDGALSVDVGVKDGRLFYTVARKGEAVVDTSYLAIDAKEAKFGANTRIKDIAHSSFDETWTQPWGEEKDVRNNYNEMRLTLAEESETPAEFAVVFRIFDDGIGFRYEIPEQANLGHLTIMDENTEFAIADDGVAWSIPWNHEYYEHLYGTSPISRLDTVCSPLTMKIKDNLYLAIHEANLTDYASMNLTPQPGSTRLRTMLTPLSTGEKVITTAPMQSPWRTVIIADNPGDLMLSRLMLNLNEPCKIADTSFCKPGRYIGIWWGMHMKDWTWEQG
ncbi:glycoside hydrolase family 97 N-terminal domain-containing protein, partial [uncultured Duncaniella sp.]|uniref:glycoside hydrolase family 97 N-terminal domain-containing protein n=1 Tax=uncultured Duncaniella sp. TaxID=2768039 RepID=UPI002659119D